MARVLALALALVLLLGLGAATTSAAVPDPQHGWLLLRGDTTTGSSEPGLTTTTGTPNTGGGGFLPFSAGGNANGGARGNSASAGEGVGVSPSMAAGGGGGGGRGLGPRTGGSPGWKYGPLGLGLGRALREASSRPIAKLFFNAASTVRSKADSAIAKLRSSAEAARRMVEKAL